MDETLTQSDDLYPTDSSMLDLNPPAEQILEEQAERGELLAAAPLLDSLLAWFDGEIALANSIDGLDVESRVSLEGQVLARQILKEKLEGAKSRLQASKDSFLPQYNH